MPISMLMIPAQAQHPSNSSGASPLSAEHLQALSDARLRSAKIRRAAFIAAFSGWTMAVFAFFTLLGALFGDLASLLLGVGLSVVAWNELRGGAMIRRFDPAGAKRLGYNQVALAAMIVLYAVWSLVSALNNPVMDAVGGSTGDPKMDAMISRLNIALAWGIYGGIALFGIIGPGLTAWYYFTRAKVIRTVMDQTPEWVIHTMRAAA